MKDSTNSPESFSSGMQHLGSMLWSGLKGKRISYLTIPLLVMATVTEFVILATGWKYQQTVCVPKGMGVTFFGIGPIGATILAVELLKLPLAIWTASRMGWQKVGMLAVGLPLICVLTFQLVKDMAVYEMGVAMTPASQFLEKAAAEETKITQLQGDLAAIEQKKAARETKVTEFAAKQAKAKAELEEALKRNDVIRQDAINLTDYQKKELSEVEARQAAIVRQFNNDTIPLTKALDELRARREAEFPRAAKWNAEEARIENAYKKKVAEYTNQKTAYEKDKAEYAQAGFIKRKLMGEPADPGVPPDRESNTVVKPTLIVELDAQIAAKEAELLAVNNKRRERIAGVSDDANRIRQEFDHRSTAKREEIDRQRQELLAAQNALTAELKAEQKQIDQDLSASVKGVDGLRAEIDGYRKVAEGYYEQREAAIKDTQVHRIATTVEIIRGLIFGEHPISVTATAKERGDRYTDQISMVRIWVYPVLAFIVAFLPTLMVEIGFSTIFHRDEKRPPFRAGFLGQNLHRLYTRAGRLKILRAERQAREYAAAKALTEQNLREKTAAWQAANHTIAVATDKHADQMKKREEEWDAKFASLSDSLNQAQLEKDALRDFQQLEIERQVQLRQDAWSDRIAKMQQEMDTQHATNEAERTEMAREQQKKLLEVSEDCRAQVAQARRQVADAELAAEEISTKRTLELNEAVQVGEDARAQLQQQIESLSLELTQVKEAAARETEKAVRQEKHRSERLQSDTARTVRQRNEEMEHRLKQREQELSLEFNARLAGELAKAEQAARVREEEFAKQLEVQAKEVDARWNQELKQREEGTQARLKQREQQLLAQTEVRLSDLQKQATQELRRREAELERQAVTQSHQAEAHLKHELETQELEFQSKLKQREQELTVQAGVRETELHNQWAAETRAREEEGQRQADERFRATEAQWSQQAQEQAEQFLAQSRQRDQAWQAKIDTLRTDLQSQNDKSIRQREVEAEAGQRAQRELESSLRKEMQQREETALARAKQAEQELIAKFIDQEESRMFAAKLAWEQETEKKISTAIQPLKTQLVRTEKERDEAKQSAAAALSHVHDMEKKLTEASTFLSTWNNGKALATTNRG